jgi:hypothetical protein
MTRIVPFSRSTRWYSKSEPEHSALNVISEQNIVEVKPLGKDSE